MDPSVRFLDNAVAYSEVTFKSAVKKLTDTLVKPFNNVWDKIKGIFEEVWFNFVNFSVDSYLGLVYLLSELVAEGRIPKK